MTYIDTSAWVAMLCFESKAVAVKAWLSQQITTSIYCSDWVHTELMSALSIKHRRGEISLIALEHVHQTIDDLTRDGSHWATPVAGDFLTASQLCASPITKLRAGDALHLAIAKRLKCTHFFTLDEVLGTNAVAMGFNTIIV